ncbi:MAG: GTP cyclohydrolase I [Candidatus Dormibacteria bacterium]
MESSADPGDSAATGRAPEPAGLRDLAPWEHAQGRALTAERWAQLEGCAAQILTGLGMDLDQPATRATPGRFLRALYDSTLGYEGDPKLLTVFPTECRGGADCAISQIIEGPIGYFALCEHHALPFHGRAHVAYIAHEHIIGLSKLTRLVQVFSRRFTVQERIGQQVADWLVEHLEPHGVAVHLEAVHLCTQMRGVRERQSLTTVSFWRGAYEADPSLRQAFLGSVWGERR